MAFPTRNNVKASDIRKIPISLPAKVSEPPSKHPRKVTFLEDNESGSPSKFFPSLERKSKLISLKPTKISNTP